MPPARAVTLLTLLLAATVQADESCTNGVLITTDQCDCSAGYVGGGAITAGNTFADCEQCAAGRYQDQAGQTDCKGTACAAGKYFEQMAQTVAVTCKDCDAGQFTSETGQQSCSPHITCNPQEIKYRSDGKYQLTPPSVTQDRVCGYCADGKAAALENAAKSDCLPQPSFEAHAIVGRTQTFEEGSAGVAVQDDLILTWGIGQAPKDVTEAAVVIESGYTNGEDELFLANAASFGLTASWSIDAGVLTITGTAASGVYVNALKQVKYRNPSHNPSAQDRGVRFSVKDADGLWSKRDTPASYTSVSVKGVNDAPELTIVSGNATYVEGSARSPPIFASASIADPDSTNMLRARIQLDCATCTTAEIESDALVFHCDDPSIESTAQKFSYTWNAPNLELRPNPPELGVSKTDLETVLVCVRYRSNLEQFDGKQRTATIIVEDVAPDPSETKSSQAKSVSIEVQDVNDKPQVVPAQSSFEFHEGEPSVLILPDVTIEDKDTSKLKWATVTIAQQAGANDVLTLRDNNGVETLGDAWRTVNYLVQTWNSGTHELKYEAPPGQQFTIVNLQRLLREIRFSNAAVQPEAGERTIQITVNDGAMTSDPVSVTVNVFAVNDSPVLLNYDAAEIIYDNHGAPQKVLPPAFSITDEDDTRMFMAQIELVNGAGDFAGTAHDVFHVPGQSAAHAGSTPLVIGGSAATSKTIQNMVDTLRGVTLSYARCDEEDSDGSSEAFSPLQRTVRVTVTDCDTNVACTSGGASSNITRSTLLRRPFVSVEITVIQAEIDPTFGLALVKQGETLSLAWQASVGAGNNLPGDQNFGIQLVSEGEVVDTVGTPDLLLGGWQSYSKNLADRNVQFEIPTTVKKGTNYNLRAIVERDTQCLVGKSARFLIQCPINRYGDQCEGCGLEYYQDPAVTMGCLQCAENQITASTQIAQKSRADCYCAVGFYKQGAWDKDGKLLGRESTKDLPCVPCPEGAYCPGVTGAQCDEPPCHSPPITEPGYWSRKSSYDQVMACNPKTACLGGRAIFEGKAEGPQGTSKGQVKNDDCNVGYLGQACSICSREGLGYYRIHGECRECPEGGKMLLALYGLCFALLSVVIHYLYRRHGQLFSLMMPSITITTNYFQVLANFATFQFWPAPIDSIFTWLSIANLNMDIVSPDCVGVAYETKWLLVQALPVFSVISLVGAVAVCYLRTFVKHIVLTRAWREAPKVAFEGVQAWVREGKLGVKVGSTLVLLDAIYLQVCGKLFEIFDCKEQFPGHFVLEAEPRLYCAVFWPGDPEPEASIDKLPRDRQHKHLLPWGFFFLFANVIGIPCLFTRVLFWRRLNAEGEKYFVAQETQGRFIDYRRFSVMEYKDPVQITYGVIYERFSEERWYWILVLLAKEVSLVICGVMFTSYTNFKLALMCFVLFMAYTLQLVYKPYINVNDTAAAHHLSDYNALEGRLLGICIVILLSGFIFEAANTEMVTVSGEQSTHQKNFIFVIIIAMTIVITTSKIYVFAVVTRELTRAMKLHNFRRKSLALGLKEGNANPLMLPEDMASKRGKTTQKQKQLEADNKKLREEMEALKRKLKVAGGGKGKGKKKGRLKTFTAAPAAVESKADGGSVANLDSEAASNDEDANESQSATAKKARAVPVLETKTFEVFALDDPTNELPEGIELKLKSDGVHLCNQNQPEDDALLHWPWATIKEYSGEVTRDEEFPDEMDILHVRVAGEDNEKQTFAFECDDANAIVDVLKNYGAQAGASEDDRSDADNEAGANKLDVFHDAEDEADDGNNVFADADDGIDIDDEDGDGIGATSKGRKQPRKANAQRRRGSTGVDGDNDVEQDTEFDDNKEGADGEEFDGGDDRPDQGRKARKERVKGRKKTAPTARRKSKIEDRRGSADRRALDEDRWGDEAEGDDGGGRRRSMDETNRRNARRDYGGDDEFTHRNPIAAGGSNGHGRGRGAGSADFATMEAFTFDVPPRFSHFPDDVRIDARPNGIDVVDADTDDVVAEWTWRQVVKTEAKSGVGGAGDVFALRIKGHGQFLFETRDNNATQMADSFGKIKDDAAAASDGAGAGGGAGGDAARGRAAPRGKRALDELPQFRVKGGKAERTNPSRGGQASPGTRSISREPSRDRGERRWQSRQEAAQGSGLDAAQRML